MLRLIAEALASHLFKKAKDARDRRRKNVRRYDCRENRWGHACYIDEKPKDEERKVWTCSGALSPPVSVGDEVIKNNHGGKAMVLRFTEVNNWSDPRDGFNGTLEVIGPLAEVGEKQVTDELSESAKIMLEGRTPESHPDQFWRRS